MANQADFPLQVAVDGRTATVDDAGHLRDLIEQVLFTSPGERVMRPTFGAGLLRLVFEPADSELVNATQFLVQASLQQWLGDRIAVAAVSVAHRDAALHVTVQFVDRRTGASASETFVRGV